MDMERSMSADSEGFILVESPSRPTLQHPYELDSVASYFVSLHDAQHDVFSYEHIDRIKRARAQHPDGRLFVDELLALVDIDGPSCYPCHSPAELASLLGQLLSSPHGQLKGYSIIFYLCLAEASTDPDSTSPAAFVRDMLVPAGFVRAIEGFYALDSGAFKNAVGALTDPHLTPDFVEKTLDVLSELPPVDERAGLVISYWNLSGVVLEGERQVSRIIDAMCDRTRSLGLVQAWKMQRGWEDEVEREGLVTRILRRCFGDNSSGTPVPHHIQALLSSPFNASEDVISHAFCLSPPSSLSPAQAALAADFRISKYVAEGRPLEALRFGRQVEQKGLKGTDARARLLRAVRETLTAIQRNAADLDAELSSTAGQSNPTTSTVPMAVEELTQPTWHPRAAAPPQAPITSLRDLVPPPPAAKATVADLPLSASPFLRKGTMLVGSSDGTSMGGVQKSVLKAMRDAAGGIPASPQGTPAKKTPGLDFGRATGTPVRSLFGDRKAVDRQPTLRGFGSMRTPGASRLGSSFGEEDEVEMRSPSPPPSPPPVQQVATTSRGFRDLQQRQQNQYLQPSAAAVAPLSFSERATHDPAIASTLALAAAESSTPSRAPKRRTFSSQQPLVSNGGDKRRAVSTEVEDRPSASVQAAGGRRPPGAFPAQSADESEMDTEGEAERVEMVQVKRTQPIRRSARASSVVAASAGPSTPRNKRTGSVQGTPSETPRTTAVRRRTRLTTPMVESEEEVEKPKRRGTASKKGRKQVVEEDED